MKEKIIETVEQRIARLANASQQKLTEGASEEVLSALGITKDPVADYKYGLVKGLIKESLTSTIHKDCRDSLKENLEKMFESRFDYYFDVTKGYDKIRECVKIDVQAAMVTEGLSDTYIASVRETLETKAYAEFEKICVEARLSEKETSISESFKALIEAYSELGITGEEGNEQAAICSTMGALMPLTVKSLSSIFKTEGHIHQFLNEYGKILENPFA